MAVSGTTETEIKLRLDNPQAIEARARLPRAFDVTKPRIFEANTVFDDSEGGLRPAVAFSGCAKSAAARRDL